MSYPGTTHAPYKGLAPYREPDAPFFFGRNSETEIIAANLMAARLTILYGPSGVGKSSVLLAGVAHKLLRQAERNLAKRGTPEYIVVVFSSWQDDPLAGFRQQVRATVLDAIGHPEIEPSDVSNLSSWLTAWSELARCDLLVIMDQFEEYFWYHPDENGPGTFREEFAEAVEYSKLTAHFLISIREDALARLDAFQGRISGLFNNLLRIEPLSREAGRQAITGPATHYNSLLPNDAALVQIEDALVDAILDGIQSYLAGSTGSDSRVGSAFSSVSSTETSSLQLTMKAVWDAEVASGSHVLRLETLLRLDGIRGAWEKHIDGVLSQLPNKEQDLTARLFEYLITPSGSKNALNASDLAKYTGAAEGAVVRVCEKLSGSDARILRHIARPADSSSLPRYEIFHDILAAPLLDWQERHQRLDSQKRHQRALWLPDLPSEKIAKWERLGIPLIIFSVLLIGAVLVRLLAGPANLALSLLTYVFSVSVFTFVFIRRLEFKIPSDMAAVIEGSTGLKVRYGPGSYYRWPFAERVKALVLLSTLYYATPGQEVVARCGTRVEVRLGLYYRIDTEDQDRNLLKAVYTIDESAISMQRGRDEVETLTPFDVRVAWEKRIAMDSLVALAEVVPEYSLAEMVGQTADQRAKLVRALYHRIESRLKGWGMELQELVIIETRKVET